MTAPARIAVGAIVSAHGVKGQVKLRPFTDTADVFLNLPAITDESGRRPFRIKKHGVQGDLLIVSIEGVTDRNEAELLRGTKLFAPAEAMPEKGENQWTYGELTGLEARLGNGQVYGKVIGVYNFGAGDLLDIELPGGKTEMLPFSEPFVGDVHAEEGFLIVSPPDYVEVGKEQPDE